MKTEFKLGKTKKAQFFLHTDQEHMLVIIPSGTRDYYHVVYDSAIQNNSYEHLTSEQILSKHKIVL